MHAITVYIRVLSNYKFERAIVSILGKCVSIRDLHDAMACVSHMHNRSVQYTTQYSLAV